MLLEQAVDELLGNALDGIIAAANVVDVVSNLKQAGQRREFKSGLNFLRDDAQRHIRVNEDLFSLPLQRQLDALAALECDDLFSLGIDGN